MSAFPLSPGPSSKEQNIRLPASDIRRGAVRLMRDLGYDTVAEFTLGNGRRIDLSGLDRRGRFAFVEIKSSVADFRADRKWRSYLEYCDLFYFAVAPGFPLQLLSGPGSRPERTGIIIADQFGGEILRDSTPNALSSGRRKSQTLRFARTAAARLYRPNECE